MGYPYRNFCLCAFLGPYLLVFIIRGFLWDIWGALLMRVRPGLPLVYSSGLSSLSLGFLLNFSLHLSSVLIFGLSRGLSEFLLFRFKRVWLPPSPSPSRSLCVARGLGLLGFELRFRRLGV